MALYVGAAILGLAKNIIYLKISGGGGNATIQSWKNKWNEKNKPIP